MKGELNMLKKNRKKIFTLGEKKLYTLAFIFVISSLILQVFCGANIGNLSITVEKLKYEISNQEKENESLNMKVSELTAYSNVKDVVKDMGLTYNSDNIINVAK